MATPISDIAMIFLNDIDVMADPNVRKAAAHAINKPLIIERLLSGYGIPIDTLQTPDYAAYDATTTVEFNPDLSKELLAASGYSVDNPVKFTIQTTRGFKPKDYEMVPLLRWTEFLRCRPFMRKVGLFSPIEICAWRDGDKPSRDCG